METDVPHQVQHTVLPPEKTLLPLFEAVVNSIQAIEDCLEGNTRTIDIGVIRENTLDGIDLEGRVESFTITDSGIGFNRQNFDAFFTAFTPHKKNRGGKGIGRFTWLKAFEEIHIESHFLDPDQMVMRLFSFDTTGHKPPDLTEGSSEPERRTTISLLRLKSPYREACQRGLDVIARHLIEHCLPLLMNPSCPRITLADNQSRLVINDLFSKDFAANATHHKFSVNGNEFTLTGLRLYRIAEAHRLMYAADFREVFPERLGRHMPNLKAGRLVDSEGKKFSYLGFVEGQYLDENVRPDRTGFLFPNERSTDSLPAWSSLDEIRQEALKGVSEDLSQPIDAINEQKRQQIVALVETEAPECRVLLKDLDSFVDEIPLSSSPRELVEILHGKMFDKQVAIRRESEQLLNEAEAIGLLPEDYQGRLNKFIESANEIGKSSLAQYVVHRKVILEFLERSLERDPATGSYPLEDVIHRIIYPMHVDSSEVSYEQQNLWIIDEKLAFHSYLASDKRLHKIGRLATTSLSRPDIVIFDDAVSFAPDEDILTSLVIVEFKRPDRDNFGSESPLDQAHRLIKEIRAGTFKTDNGKRIAVASDEIPAYAYIVCDLSDDLIERAVRSGLRKTADRVGYSAYMSELHTYIELIPYAKLVADAKKRNRILFEKLHMPLRSRRERA